MPTFVYMTRCDGCGHCVDICPSDIMHIDKTTRRAYNIEPNMCWECYSCVKACPQHAIDARGYADFAPLGHSVRVLREEEKGTISWKIKFSDGREKTVLFGSRCVTAAAEVVMPDRGGSIEQDVGGFSISSRVTTPTTLATAAICRFWTTA